MGPVQNIHRYFAARYSYYWSTSASDGGAAPRGYQGLAFSIYGAPQAGATTPLYRCEWSNGNAPRLAAAHTNCAVPEVNLMGGAGQGLNPSTAILGYLAAAPQAGAADKPLYYCELQPIVVDSFLITANLGECNGNPAAILGYVF